MRHADIDFRFDDVLAEMREKGLARVFERLRASFRAVREALVLDQGTVRVIQHNIPPTAPPTVAALPTASAKLVGQIVQLDLDGVSDDTVHICIKETAGTFAWKQFTLV